MTAQAQPRTPGQRRPADSDAGCRADPHRWVIHLPTTLTTLDAAIALVRQLRDYLGHVDVLDFGGATLSEKDRLMVRHQVFCDHPLAGRLRCVLHHEHDGPCAAGSAPRPAPER